MKKEISEDQKAKKAAYNKAYAAKKRAEKLRTQDWMSMDKFEMSFAHKVRLFRNLKLEKTNSYCAAPNTPLVFEKIKNEDNTIVFRVRRTGRRTFFTTSEQLQTPAQ